MGADIPLLELGGFSDGRSLCKNKPESAGIGDKKNSGQLIQYQIYLCMGITENTILQEIEKIREFQSENNPWICITHVHVIKINGKKRYPIFTGATVATTGDMLYPHYRKIIEKQFNCKIFDGYGGESTAVSFECEEHNGYHICDEDVIVEFFKEDEHVVPGETGRIVFTNLNNYAMPFIRYDIEDIGTYTDESCPCGRGLSLMKSVEGRDSDIIMTPDGDIIVVQFFLFLFEYIAGVDSSR